MSPASDAFRDAPAHFKLALTFLGVRERFGDGSLNPIVRDFFKHTRYPAHLITVKTPWCAAFACAMLERSKVLSPRSAAALDFLTWGVDCNPEVGDLLIIRRHDATNEHAAHVTFYGGEGGDHYVMGLGGNQGDEVKIAFFEKSAVLGCRRAA